MRSGLGVLLALVCVASVGTAQFGTPGTVMPLRDGWTLESGCTLKEGGATISSTQYKPGQGYHVAVPSTVLAAQVSTGEYPDPFFSMNLRKMPGMTYPIGENFSNLPMPADSPYRCSWWYRKQFAVPAQNKGREMSLHFDGINYRANIWLNGKLIADSKQIAGAYRTYDLGVTSSVKPGQANVLVVEVMAPTETDLGINWVDWNPCPPDKDMGLIGAVFLQSKGPVSVIAPAVSTHFTDASLDEAQLTAYGDVLNNTGQSVHGTVTVTLLGMHMEQAVDLAPGEGKTVVFAPQLYPQLVVKHPVLWWPRSMGTPHLQTVSMRFVERGKVSDEQQARFGIREMTSGRTSTGGRLFRVNGKPILIRGGGWSQDMLLRENSDRLHQEFALVSDLNLNTIRLEGKLETEEFYKLADEQGILVMAGWCCCDQWEHWAKWTPENFQVAADSLRSQMLRLRSHASLLAWLNGSDNPPPAGVEQAYLNIEKERRWPNPVLSSASATRTTVSGESGVKMSGPYDFVAPSYWLVDTSHCGGAFGYNTETSPGPAIPTVDSLRKFLPADKLWPLNQDWAYHNGGEGFKELTVYNTAMAATYGAPTSLEDYERISQAMAYDGERAMFEAYSQNKYRSTGVVQWMLNNAWPSTIWHLFDYYLDAGGGYYGAKKACEPVHIQYSYSDHGVFVVNSTYVATGELQATARVYDVHLKKVFTGNAAVHAEPDSSSKVIAIPDAVFQGGSDVYFVQLSLAGARGEPASRNFYWVPAKLTTFDWAKSDYTHTPALQSEKMTELRELPPAAVTGIVLPPSVTRGTSVRLVNTSRVLALQVAVRALDAKGYAIEPVFWSDNYVSLMPGEQRDLVGKLWPGDRNTTASVQITGWNLKSMTVAVHGAEHAKRISALR